MKKILFIIMALLALILATTIAIPFLFKDKIKAKINAEIEKKIASKVFYDEVGISIFKNFPQVTVSLNNFGIVGIAPFNGDTLISANAFHTSFDIKSLFNGKTISVNKIAFDSPNVLIKILKDGSKNYDIYQNKSVNTNSVTSTNFSAKITDWEINNGKLIFDDKENNSFATLDNINHSGNGNIFNDQYDLITNTNIEKVNVKYKNIEYLKNRKIIFEGPILADNKAKSYSLKDGKMQINDFPIDLSGSISFPDTNTNVDFSFKTTENESFKKLLSLIPTIFTNKYDELEAEGKFTLTGKVKGPYNQRQIPTFDIDLKVEEGKMKYPKLSASISAINLNSHFENKTDNLQNTLVNVKAFNLNFGKNPIKGRLLLTGLENSNVDAEIKGNINLDEITKIFPVKDLIMKGLAKIDIQAKGKYSKQLFPIVNAKVDLSNGFIKSNKFAEPIENIFLKSTMVNTTGRPNDTKIDIAEASLVMQSEPFKIQGTLQNLNDAIWDLKAKGKLDLTKITAIFPLEGMKLKGKIDADISTSGQMSAIKNNQFARANVAGKAILKDFEFWSKDYPQGFTAKTADLTFTPSQVNVQNASGFLGKSDYSGSGSFSNYFGYMFNNEPLKGNLTVDSKSFDINEWMVDDPNTSKSANIADNISAVKIPAEFDLNINASIGQSKYEKMDIKNAIGNISIKDGIVTFQNVKFNSLGGRFTTDGSYDSKDIAHPKFDFSLDLEKLDIAQSYNHLWIVRNLVPIAEYLLGNFSTKFKLNGELGQDMVPKLMSLSGKGLIKMIQAQVKENPVLKEVADQTKLPALKDVLLKDLLMTAEMKNGRMGFSPFNFAIKDYKFNVGGFNSVDGSLDWNITIDSPTGKVGTEFSNVFTKWTGKTLQGTDRVKFDLKMGGSFKKPKIAFVGSPTANAIKETVKAEVQAQIDAAKAKAQAELDKLKAEAEAKKKELEDKVKAEAEKLKTAAEAKKKELEDKAKAEIERRKKEAEEKVKAELKLLEDKARAEVERLKKIAEEKIRAKADSVQKIAYDKAKKVLEEKQKEQLEKGKKALEERKKAAAEKVQKAIDDKKKEADAAIEAEKKATEERLKKVTEKDTTKN